MNPAAFELFLPPTRASSVILSSPHSGRDYDEAFLRRSLLDRLAIRSSEDAFVDMLVSDAPRLGAPLLAARVPRAYVDLNRAAEELDPALIEGVARHCHNPRVSSGLGVIPRVVSNGRAIYRGKLTLAEAETRLTACWHPYHAALQALIEENRTLFGEAVLLDMHSMPREAIDGFGRGNGPRPDVVLGDRFGATAAPDIVAQVEDAFVAAGLRVVRNAPFAGAYITQHYGRPGRGQHVIQIEIDRSLYMDEATLLPHGGFDALKATLSAVLSRIIDFRRPARQLAAE